MADSRSKRSAQCPMDVCTAVLDRFRPRNADFYAAGFTVAGDE
jgi:hypothetical protein